MSATTMTRSFDDMLDALADVQRRTLLLSLLDHNPQGDAPVSTDPDRDVATVERLVEMNHVHLPKLEEYGFVEWDPRTHEVVKGPNFEEIRPLLELLAEHDGELPDDWIRG